MDKISFVGCIGIIFVYTLSGNYDMVIGWSVAALAYFRLLTKDI